MAAHDRTNSPLNAKEVERYARHLSLDQVGATGQARLRDCSVAVIGAGGLGSPCLLYLAAAGIGRIGIFDDDVVDASNLQRQILHGTSSVGEPKVQSAQRRLTDLNPLVTIEAHQVRLSPDNALQLLESYDIVVDGTDNFSARYLINDACELLGKPVIYGAIQRFEGQVSVFNHQGGPTYRDLFPQPPPAELAPNCAEAGVLGVLPGIIGTLQATEVIKLALGRPDVLAGRLLLYDALAVRFDELTLTRDPQRPPVTDLTAVQTMCAAPRWTDLSTTKARSMLTGGWAAIIVDVRGAEEAALGQIKDTSYLIPHTQIRRDSSQLPPDGDLLLYCRSGVRSAIAADILVECGVAPERIFNLQGGIMAWASTD